MQRDEARSRVVDLVNRYRLRASEYEYATSPYNETQLRSDYLNPLLEALGWDVNNNLGAPTFVREVVQEYPQPDGTERRRPDYAIRAAGSTRYFVEAKKPSVNITGSPSAALQVRRYGWTDNLPVSVLSNFRDFVVYDCTVPPMEGEDERVARLMSIHFEDYEARFDDLWGLFSKEAVVSGAFEEAFSSPADRRVSEPFDEYFLRQLDEWRLTLGAAVVASRPEISDEDLNYVSQQLLNRILFLRICEDRQFETYETLLGVSSFDELTDVFEAAERRYNSGLFDFIQDRFTPELALSTEAVRAVLADLYYPASPFDFSVLDPATLGQVYELFLGRRLVRGASGLELVDRPEVSIAQGAVTTPHVVARRVVRDALSDVVDGRSPAQILDLRVADLSCGSGQFLVTAYEYLLAYLVDWYVREEPDSQELIELGPDRWKLTYALKRQVLERCIFGIDVDICAVELSRFSLLLKLLEDEFPGEVETYTRTSGLQVLPSMDSNVVWGNSLVGTDFVRLFPQYADEQTLKRVRPMDWSSAFPAVHAEGGFDAVIGNPPYVRIQNMARYAAEEKSYLQSPQSPYVTTRNSNIDKYFAFVERAVSLLKPSGRCGFIVKNAFFFGQAGESLRRLLTTDARVSSIVDFGTELVFCPARQVYTCILSVGLQPVDDVDVEEVGNFLLWRQGNPGMTYSLPADSLGHESWLLAPSEVVAVFDKLRHGARVPLKDLAPPYVGVQTSCDAVYVLKDATDLGNGRHRFLDGGGATREIESGILRPALYDERLRPYSRVHANASMLFPYRVLDGRAVAISEHDMETEFPLALAYLRYAREALEDRDVQGGQDAVWYRYGRTQSLAKFDGRQKVVWSVLSQEPHYALDTSNCVFTGGGNGPYYALALSDDAQVDLRYLMAILMHPAVDSLVHKLASAFRGRYASHGKQFLENIPVPIIDFTDPAQTAVHGQLVALVEEMLDLSERLRGDVSQATRNELSALFALRQDSAQAIVSDLYGLTQNDLDTLRGYMSRLG